MIRPNDSSCSVVLSRVVSDDSSKTSDEFSIHCEDVQHDKGRSNDSIISLLKVKQSSNTTESNYTGVVPSQSEVPIVCISLIEDGTDPDVDRRNENTAAKTEEKVKAKAIICVGQFLVKCRTFGGCKDLFESRDAMEYHV